MLVTLTDKEVREALLNVAKEKTNHALSAVDVDQCHFEIETADGDASDVESVMFVVDFG